MGPGSYFCRWRGYRKSSDWRNAPPMMLMMLAPLASISIMRAPFTNFKVSGCSHFDLFVFL